MASKMKKNDDADIRRHAEAERLGSRLVTLTIITILYAFLMLFLQNMSKSSETVLGAQGFIQILFWGGIVGAMACAALGAYKENKGMFTYCAMFLYVLWSAMVIQYCGNMGADKAYALVYISLIIIFIMTQVFSFLSNGGKIEKKTLTVFTVVAIALFVLLCAAAVCLRFRFFGLL